MLFTIYFYLFFLLLFEIYRSDRTLPSQATCKQKKKLKLQNKRKYEKKREMNAEKLNKTRQMHHKSYKSKIEKPEGKI